MKVFEANITSRVSEHLGGVLKETVSFEIANKKLYDEFRILQFFDNNGDLATLKETILDCNSVLEEVDRAEFGDFQTNCHLANEVALYLVSKTISPEVVVEPTCGKGNFIIAALKNFPKIKSIFGIEIYKPYVWETKFNIVDFFLDRNKCDRPDITIEHSNVFDFNFKQIERKYSSNNILIIGNPPWVTTSKLSSLNSTNLPKKANFKNHKGLDAVTGKGNFDIAESITLLMLTTFQEMEGNLIFLVKNSVVKNIIFDQYKKPYRISEIEKHNIDSKREFNVSVEASLFYCKLNSTPAFNCDEYNFYKRSRYLKFGWIDDQFVSNVDSYTQTREIDGESPFIWRQGLKHDCSAVMELDKVEGCYLNGLNEKINLEDGLIYGILKSSDLKNSVINRTRKYTIVTQKKIGQETTYIKYNFPNTFQYLINHLSNFQARKSSIYLNKPLFSIFGIGDYSFKPYKVAISGLYKTFHFTLILPQDNKPVMLDDTCYLLGFDKIEKAVYTLILLNSEKTMCFLKSITFNDAKRTFTKDVLMRINLFKLATDIDIQSLEAQLSNINKMYGFNLTLDLWENFVAEMTPAANMQMAMF